METTYLLLFIAILFLFALSFFRSLHLFVVSYGMDSWPKMSPDPSRRNSGVELDVVDAAAALIAQQKAVELMLAYEAHIVKLHATVQKEGRRYVNKTSIVSQSVSQSVRQAGASVATELLFTAMAMTMETEMSMAFDDSFYSCCLSA